MNKDIKHHKLSHRFTTNLTRQELWKHLKGKLNILQDHLENDPNREQHTYNLVLYISPDTTRLMPEERTPNPDKTILPQFPILDPRQCSVTVPKNPVSGATPEMVARAAKPFSSW